jgi:DNA-binding response OmpR family regulator
MSKRIFVAEDDQAILDVIKIILENDGYTIETTDTGDNIHEKIQKFEPHVVLLDIWLSGHDGGEIAKELKKNEKTKDFPVVIISANNATQQIAKEAGVNDFLQKPFDIDDLLRVVKKHSRREGD